MRTRIAWSLVLPILVLCEFGGHWLAYLAVAPASQERAALLARTGHDYLSYLHPLLGVLLALALAGLVVRTRESFARAMVGRVPSRGFALLLPLAFLLQENLERLVHDGHVKWSTIAEPAVRAGLPIQLLCGLFALWLIRLLLRFAHAVGRALARRVERPTPRARRASRVRPAGVDLPRLAPLAHGIAGRGPPLVSF